jgi:hypothetical protein
MLRDLNRHLNQILIHQFAELSLKSIHFVGALESDRVLAYEY